MTRFALRLTLLLGSLCALVTGLTLLLAASLGTDAYVLAYADSDPNAPNLAYPALLDVTRRLSVHIVKQPLVDTTPPRWSPDGQRLALSLLSAADDPDEADIYVVRPDGRGLLRLTDDAQAEVAPRWSPDGRYLAYGQVQIMSINRAFLLSIVLPDSPTVGKTTLRGGVLDTADWSPDSKWLAVSWRAGRTSEESMDIALYRVTPNGSGTPYTELTRRIERPQRYDEAPDWSPDGQRVAFVSDARHGSEARLAVTDRRGYVQLEVRVGERLGVPTVPSWSPDGQRIAMGYKERQPGATFKRRAVVIDAETGLILAETPPGVDLIMGAEAWSPDGHWLAVYVMKQGTDSAYLALMDPSDGSLHPLITMSQRTAVPDWRP